MFELASSHAEVDVLVPACVCASALVVTLAAAASAASSPRTGSEWGLAGVSAPCSWEMPSFYYDDDGELQCVCPDEPDDLPADRDPDFS